MDQRTAVCFSGLTPGNHTIDLFESLQPGAVAPTSGFGRRLASLYDQAAQYFRQTSLDEAQIVVCPHRFEPGAAMDRAIAEAKSRQLPCLFLNWGDDPHPSSTPYGIVYRHSIYRSSRLPCEYAMPAIAEDSLEYQDGRVELRGKSSRPSVGFRGFCGTTLSRTAYALSGRTEKARGLRLRARILKQLQRSPRVSGSFEPQVQFFGKAFGTGAQAEERSRSGRHKFLESIIDNDYTLCVRGAGNFSYRFYEVLSAGRVPIFVDTDCMLPFDDVIDWKEHVIWVDETQLPQIGDVVADFNDRITDSDFRAMQEKNRQLWERFLTPTAFWRHAIASAIDGATAVAARTSWP